MNTTQSTRHRKTIIAVAVSAIAIVALAVIALPSLADRTAAPTSVPFIAVFELDHEVAYIPTPEYDGSIDAEVAVRPDGAYVRSTDRFQWEFTSWSDWTWSRLCCTDPIDGSDSRQQIQVRPDGTKWVRDEPNDDWEFGGTFDPSEGVAPLPDLANRTTGKAGKPSAGALSTMDRLSLNADDAATVEIAEGAVRTYSSTLELTVEYTERAPDNYMVRQLRLIELAG